MRRASLVARFQLTLLCFSIRLSPAASFLAEAMRYIEGRRRITDAREVSKELCPDLLKYY